MRTRFKETISCKLDRVSLQSLRCTRRHGNGVNDQAADDDDESSLSLDRSFVVRAIENRLIEIFLTIQLY